MCLESTLVLYSRYFFLIPYNLWSIDFFNSSMNDVSLLVDSCWHVWRVFADVFFESILYPIQTDSRPPLSSCIIGLSLFPRFIWRITFSAWSLCELIFHLTISCFNHSTVSTSKSIYFETLQQILREYCFNGARSPRQHLRLAELSPRCARIGAAFSFSRRWYLSRKVGKARKHN